jgi:hypothetical protein
MKHSFSKRAVLGVACTIAALTGITSTVNATQPPARVAIVAPVSAGVQMGNWAWYGYRLNWSETNQIANISLWNAVSGVKGSGLIPYSTAIMAIYSINWILTARNARSMGSCLAISYAGTGLIVGCS